MANSPHTGVYFRILQEGGIRPSDKVKRTHRAKVPFTLYEAHETIALKKKWTREQMDRALMNGAFSQGIIRKFLS